MNTLYKTEINTTYEIESLNDLPKLKILLEASNMKPNYTKIGEALNKDPRTIKSHYEAKDNNKIIRKRKSLLDEYYDIMIIYLSNQTPNKFYYKKCLTNFLKEFHGITIKESTLRSYFTKRPLLNKLFKFQKNKQTNYQDILAEIEIERNLVYDILEKEKPVLGEITLPPVSGLLFQIEEYEEVPNGNLPPINNVSRSDIEKNAVEYNDSAEKELIYSKGSTRNEQPPGFQAQLDWKENQIFTLKCGKQISINIGMLLLSYSRYKFIFFSIDKTQYSLFDFLTNVFIELNGSPEQIVTDNMKTIMDQPRTRFSNGKMNDKAIEFANTFGFEFKPCVAHEPYSKGKVESPMKLFDYIFAYDGLIDLEELVRLVYKIAIVANNTVCQGTNYIPSHYLNEEKKNIKLQLPQHNQYSSYLITIHEAIVDSTGLFTYKQNKYSVPNKYKSKKVLYKVIGNKLQVYYNNSVIALHDISQMKLNIDRAHNVYAYLNNQNWIGSKTEQGLTSSKEKDNLEELGAIYE